MKKIGITGTIGSGKSTFAYLIREAGWPVFDADASSRTFLQKGTGSYDEIVAWFGPDVVDEQGSLISAAISRRVFGNEENRLMLNQIIHPRVKADLLAFMEAHRQEKLVFAEVPLLYEAGWEDLFDLVTVLTCSEENAVDRLMRDRGYTREQAEGRLRSQVSREIQIAKADKVIHNDGTAEMLAAETARWLKELEEGEENGTEDR
ncbi:MAG: dephospho-CoA kinase [Solobacterium sp.]|nr:dephospho-CoA kinase [Solobacterium sp.]MBQ6532189.1 dephospho-CoA kinase [Solobacterium sp.]MBR0214543.1 dephospho-CoA kinase [Solobacterium sp.]